MALLGILTIAEVSACVVLVVPTLHGRLGTEVPSIGLWVSMWVEMLLYHGFGDWEITMKFLFLTASLAGIALLRSDTRARGQALGIPVQGIALSVEAGCELLTRTVQIHTHSANPAHAHPMHISTGRRKKAWVSFTGSTLPTVWETLKGACAPGNPHGCRVGGYAVLHPSGKGDIP